MEKMGPDWEPKKLGIKIDLDVKIADRRITFQITWNSAEDVLELTKEVGISRWKNPDWYKTFTGECRYPIYN